MYRYIYIDPAWVCCTVSIASLCLPVSTSQDVDGEECCCCCCPLIVTDNSIYIYINIYMYTDVYLCMNMYYTFVYV